MTSASLGARNLITWSVASPALTASPTASATVDGTSSGSTMVRRSTNHTPPDRWCSSSSPTATASLVLPDPPPPQRRSAVGDPTGAPGHGGPRRLGRPAGWAGPGDSTSSDPPPGAVGTPRSPIWPRRNSHSPTSRSAVTQSLVASTPATARTASVRRICPPCAAASTWAAVLTATRSSRRHVRRPRRDAVPSAPAVEGRATTRSANLRCAA